MVKRYNLKQLDELFITQIPLSYTETLPRSSSSKWDVRRLCKDKICCEFSMKYVKYDVSKDKSKYVYKLTAFSGKEKFMDEQSKELYCAVVACTTDSTTSCGKRFQPSDALVPSIKFSQIKIKMIVELKATQNDYLAMPTNVDFSMLPLDTSQYGFARSSVYSANKWVFNEFILKLQKSSKTWNWIESQDCVKIRRKWKWKKISQILYKIERKCGAFPTKNKNTKHDKHLSESSKCLIMEIMRRRKNISRFVLINLWKLLNGVFLLFFIWFCRESSTCSVEDV